MTLTWPPAPGLRVRQRAAGLGRFAACPVVAATYVSGPIAVIGFTHIGLIVNTM